MTQFTLVMILTCSRAPLVILASLLSLVNLFHPGMHWVVSAVALMALSAITDLFDGLLARKWNVTSRLGALADPLMDKVFNAVTLPAATFIALYNENVTHALILLSLDIVSMLRDQWVSFLRSVGSEFNADVSASWFGKLRTIISFVVILIIHLDLGLETLQLHHDAYEGIRTIPAGILYSLEGMLIAVTAITGISYTFSYMPYLRQASRHTPGHSANPKTSGSES